MLSPDGVCFAELALGQDLPALQFQLASCFSAAYWAESVEPVSAGQHSAVEKYFFVGHCFAEKFFAVQHFVVKQLFVPGFPAESSSDS